MAADQHSDPPRLVSHRVSGDLYDERGLSVTLRAMTGISIGYARCSTDKQDLEANRQILLELGVAADRIYLDRAYSGSEEDPRRIERQARTGGLPGRELSCPRRLPVDRRSSGNLGYLKITGRCL